MSRFTMDWSELSLQVMITFGHFLWQACAVGFIWLVVQYVGESVQDSLIRLRRGIKNGSLRETELLDEGSLARSTTFAGANFRYAIACMAFFSLPICAFATFAWVHQSRGPIVLVAGEFDKSNMTPAVIPFESTQEVERLEVPTLPTLEMGASASVPISKPLEGMRTAPLGPPVVPWSSKFQVFAPYLLVAYSFGVGLMLARFGLSIMGSSRLRRTILPITDRDLMKLIAEQSSRLGLKRIPVVALCERVSVPVVVGIVKPMIMLPPALLCGLDPNQLAAILSHEMAHIRRYDLIVNLLQRIVESLLFFHPVTWWISRRVRVERENCCDDLAAVGCGRFEYAAAMLRMAETCIGNDRRRSSELLTLSANGGNSTDFGYRIRRLIGVEETTRVGFTRRSFSIGLALVSLVTVSLVAWGQNQESEDEKSEDGTVQKIFTPEPQWGEESHGLRCRIVPVSPSMDAENVDLSVPHDRFESPDDLTFAVEIKNVSDKPISIRDIRYGKDYAETIRRTTNAKHYAPHLFDFTFTDAAGKAIARTQREFVFESHSMILNGTLVKQIEPKQSIKCLLQPAKFERSMEYRLVPGDYQVQVRYRGPSQTVSDWIAAHMQPKEPQHSWAHHVKSNFAKFSVTDDGFREPDLVWGTETDGMQAALEIRVPRDSGIPTRAPGVLPTTSLHAVLHVKNVSDKPITFVSEAGRQDDTLEIQTAKGASVKVQDVFYTGLPIDVRWILQPGEIAQLDVLTPSLNQKLAPGEYSARYTIRFNSRQSVDNEGNRTFPAPGDYDSELTTGWTPLFLREPNQAPGALKGRESLDGVNRNQTKASPNDILWGEPVGGMRLGIRRSEFERGRAILRHGEHIDYEVWIKNETDELVTIPRDPRDLQSPQLMEDGSINVVGSVGWMSFGLPEGELEKAELVLPPGQAAHRFLAQNHSASMRPPGSPLGRYGSDPLHLQPGKYPVCAKFGELKSGVDEVEIVPAARLQIRKASRVTEKIREYAAEDPREAILSWKTGGGDQQEVMVNWDQGVLVDERDLASVEIVPVEGQPEQFSILLHLKPESAAWLARRIQMYSLWDDPDMVAILLDDKPLTATRLDASSPVSKIMIDGRFTKSAASSVATTLQSLILASKHSPQNSDVAPNDVQLKNENQEPTPIKQENSSSSWIPVRPIKVTVSSEVSAKVLDDDSVRFEGDVQWQEANLQFKFDKPMIVEEIRLELLPVDSPSGPKFGRGGDKMVLFDVKPSIEDQSGKSSGIDFDDCTYLQNPSDETTANCIDYLSDTGWEVPSLSADATSHALVLRFANPITLRADQLLNLTVDSGGADEFAVLNRIRFAFRHDSDTLTP
jgi:beta-lactamase regulating signal transducer with metallopeptidase domain